MAESASRLVSVAQMGSMSPPSAYEPVLESQRAATTYRILVEVARRQPAVNQQEIADTVGVTAQAVSDYLGELRERGFVHTTGRARYEVTKEGVDWLLSETERLKEFTAHVAGDVLGEVKMETAIASAPLSEGESVSLSMRDGVLHATPGTDGSATAVAVTSASAGQDVGVTNFEGVIDYSLGTVTVLSVPPIRDGGSESLETETLLSLAGDHDLLAVDGVEGLAATRKAGLEPDIRFGTEHAVQDAATKGLTVLLLATNGRISTHTDALREQNISYELRDMATD